MAVASPPKPWERGPVVLPPRASISRVQGINTFPSTLPISTPASTFSSSSTASPPALPTRPSTLNSIINRTAANYSPYGTPYGNYGSYGGYGAYNNYGSTYSRFGGMGALGGYGGMYGGLGGMGNVYGARPGNPNDPTSLTNAFNQSTQATFQLIESIVGAFGGFAQMLESTYMATHSSFFAMISVAEQFGNLRNTLGSVLGIFTIMRWLRTVFARLTGRPLPIDATSLNPSAFARFVGNSSPKSTSARPSRKPFIMFCVAVFGLPYLMGKLIRSLARSQNEGAKILRAHQLLSDPSSNRVQPIDPSKLEFCRMLYDYTPPGENMVQGVDIAVKKGDLVAVLGKTDPMGSYSEWWRCRLRDGRIGYLPAPYMETVQRKVQPAIKGSPEPINEEGLTLPSNASDLGSTCGKSGDLPVQKLPQLMENTGKMSA